MRPAPKTATSIIVFSSGKCFFNCEFEPVGQRDEQRLAQAHGAGETAERERAPFLHLEQNVRMAGEWTEIALGDGEHTSLVLLRYAHRVEGFLAERRKTDGDQRIALAHAAQLFA